MKLSIIIVNYRSSKLILDCIDSILRFNPLLAAEIIVVDNLSGDDSREKISSTFPDVKWIDMGYNAGFARANNRGMNEALGDAFLLLNPDTVCIDNSITQCVAKLSASEYLAAGVQQLNANGTNQTSGNLFFKGGLNHLLPLPYWGDLIRWLGYRAKTKVPGIKEARSVEEVDWISGAFLMVKKQTVQEAGMLDEDFFLYAEEVEWCSRIRKRGKLCIFGDLRIIHLEGGSINKEQEIYRKGYYNLFDKKGLQLMVSNHLRVRKQYGVGWFLFLLLNYSWSVFVFWIIGTLHRLFTGRNPFGHWKQVGLFGKNVLMLWSVSPKIISGKPYFYKMF